VEDLLLRTKQLTSVNTGESHAFVTPDVRLIRCPSHTRFSRIHSTIN